MNESLPPEQIGQLLNRSIAQLEPSTLARLHDVRNNAMARYHNTADSLVWAGPRGSMGQSFSTMRKSYWMAGILLAACVIAGVGYWHHSAEKDTSDVDIAILTDELPIRAYVD